MESTCKKKVRQVVKELREQAEEEKIENSPLSGLLTGAAKHVAKQNAYEEAADMLEKRILQSEGRKK